VTDSEKKQSSHALRLGVGAFHPLMSVVHPHQLEVLDFCCYANVIDVRSPSEFHDDHIPGAINVPVAIDCESDNFDAKADSDVDAAERAGEVVIRRNIELLMTTQWVSAEVDAEYLIYSDCGGMRSRFFAAALRERGMNVDVLPGGWRAYRRWVSAALLALTGLYDYRVLCGPNGSGQSRFLLALAEAGEQVVDLRSLACHTAALEGVLNIQQPTQRQFEGELIEVLRKLDPTRPVWIEAVSQRLGALSVPQSLVISLLRSQPVFMDAPMFERVKCWREEQPAIALDPVGFVGKLEGLTKLVGRDEFETWRHLARGGDVDDLLERILVHHVDPTYKRSTLRNFAPVADRGVTIHLESLSLDELRLVAGDVSNDDASLPTEARSLHGDYGR